MVDEELNENEENEETDENAKEETDDNKSDVKKSEVPEGYEEYDFDDDSDAEDEGDEYESEESEESEEDTEKENKFENVEFNEESTGTCAYKLTATFLKERVTKDLDKAYSDINFSSNIDGFRKGKVPKWLLEQRFGKDVQEDLKNQFKYIAVQYIEDKLERTVVSEPDIDEPDDKLKRGFSFTISIAYETEPVFDLKPIEDIKIQRKKIEVPEDKITEILENIRKQNPKLDKKEGASEIGDVINVNYTLYCEDKEIADRNNETWKLEEGTFADVKLIEGEAGAVGMSIGDEREIKIKMPDEFVIPKYAGKDGSVKVKILQVQTEIEHEIDDELAKLVNFESLEALKKQILDDLTNAYTNAQKAGLTKEIVKQYIDSFDYEFPTKFMENMAEETKTRAKYDFSMKLYQKDTKIEKEELQKKVDEELAEKEEEIINNMIHELRSDFIFKKIADTERIFVTEEEYNMSVYQMAYQYQMKPEQMIKTIEDRKMENQIRNDLLTNKVRDHFYSKSSFEDIDEVYVLPEHDHEHEHEH